MSHITEITRNESYERLDSETVNNHIIEVLKDGKAYTAREIALVLFNRRQVAFPVRQAVAPRLTEMEEAGVVEVVGKVFDNLTKRNVAAYRLVE